MATFNTVPDKSSGDTFTEGMWDDYIKVNVNNLISPPVCQVTRVASGGSGTGTFNFVWDTENDDTDSMWASTPNPERITFTTAGMYVVQGMIVETTTVVNGAWLSVNGGTTVAFASIQSYSGSKYVTASAVVKAAATDYILFTYNTSGSATFSANIARMAAVWIGKA